MSGWGRNRRDDTRTRLYRIQSDNGPLTHCDYLRPPTERVIRALLTKHIKAGNLPRVAWWERADTGERGPRVLMLDTAPIPESEERNHK